MIFQPQTKLLCHTTRIREWIDTGRTTPILVEISPTGFCNASCPWCFFEHQKSTEKIDKDTLLRALDQMKDQGLKAVNWSGGGEPTLHPDFSEFVIYANKIGLKQGLFTNAYREIPHQDKFQWIRISLTNAEFEPIKKPNVPFGICVNQVLSNTRDQLIGWCLEAQKLGASYFQIRPALTVSYKKQDVIKPPVFLKRYQTKNFKVYITEYKYTESIKPKTYKECYGYHFCPSIDWKGYLSVCLYLTYDEQYRLGDLNKESFFSIWNRLPKNKPVIDVCQNCCKNHEINKILYNASKIKDIDFL